jgi:hypothetical protein
LDRGVNPGARDNEALRWARGNGHAEIVRLICRWKEACDSTMICKS